MYFRFVLSQRDEHTGVEAGLFQAAYRLARDPCTEPWLADAIGAELDWFDEWLDTPGRLSRKRRRGTVRGVSWFRPEAEEAIARARHLAWLMGEAGQPVTELRCDDPGERIWEDAMQVVAKPGRHVPAAVR